MKISNKINKINPTVFFTLLFLVFLLAVFSAYFSSRAAKLKKEESEQALKKQTQEADKDSEKRLLRSMKQGSLKFETETETENEEETDSTNKTVNLNIKASSEERNIVGYDLIVKYDTANLKFVGNQSLLPNFKVYVFNNDDGLTITGLKDPYDTSITVLNSTPILKLKFSTGTKGNYQFSILPERGKEKTQMVDDKTETFYPSLSDIIIEVF